MTGWKKIPGENPGEGDVPEYDSDLAFTLVGFHLLVGLIVLDRRGEVRRQEQGHGVVTEVSPVSGIHLTFARLRAGELRTLPPATHLLQPADPGRYALRGTGEVVVDPDYLATWTLIERDG